MLGVATAHSPLRGFAHAARLAIPGQRETIAVQFRSTRVGDASPKRRAARPGAVGKNVGGRGHAGGVLTTKALTRALTETLAGHALELLLPAVCAGCGELGAACCPVCAQALSGPEFTSCGPGVYALGSYDGVARRLVLAYKERGRRDLARPLGAALARALPYLPGARPDWHGTWWLVPAPSRRAAARARGGPHVHRLARHCAAALAERGHSTAIAPALELGAGARDNVGLSRTERFANLARHLRPRPAGAPPAGTPVVLLDDVVTTGATMAGCTRALSDLGLPVTAALALTAA